MSFPGVVRRRDPVVVPAYPSCEDCLTWSEEGIAIAAGDQVRILSNNADHSKQGSASSASWTTTSVQVNTFTFKEWPQVGLAQGDKFSLGVEQSESEVIGIAWSPEGVGIHRRCALGVLTSNLLLSIWESNGVKNEWRRTCVVNHFLNKVRPVLESDKSTAQVRAFAWAHPLSTGSGNDSWGEQILTVATSLGEVICLKVTKKEQGEYGGWILTVIARLTLEAVPSLITSSNLELSFLQKFLAQNARFQSILHKPWVVVTDKVKFQALDKISTILLGRGHETCYLPVLLEATRTLEGIMYTLRKDIPSSDAFRIYDDLKSPTQVITYCLDELPDWSKPLRGVIESYDKRIGLGGQYEIRIWGISRSPCGKEEALCVSLHPWDMYSYTPASLQKSYIVFRRLLTGITDAAPIICKQASEVLSTVVNIFTTAAIASSNNWDLQATKVLRAYVYRRAIINKQAGGDLHTSDVMGSAVPSGFEEGCDLCGKPIKLTDDLENSICEGNHIFSRCSLSLLSIQEPGISKYCSRCGRQYLNTSKLDLGSGPSLLRGLFSEFEVCAYCSGKYRG